MNEREREREREREQEKREKDFSGALARSRAYPINGNGDCCTVRFPRDFLLVSIFTLPISFICAKLRFSLSNIRCTEEIDRQTRIRSTMPFREAAARESARSSKDRGSHRSARSINISRQMSNRSVTRTRMYTHTQLSDTRARVIRSVTISRKSIIKPLSCRGYNGRGELFRAGCIVPAGLELSARHAHGDTPRCVRATNAWQFARMTRIIEMDVD